MYEFTPEAIAPYAPVLRELEHDGLLKLNTQSARLTARGRMLSNDVFARLLEVTEGRETHAGTPELALR